ncbi:MAG: MBL fold metallo-hydrolase [Candidatus Dependentiae bacterium]|nr:MBL fold metallo-hydrolase [Candidatus Dependentiae bacterium]
MKRLHPLRKNGRFYLQDEKSKGWFFTTISLFFKTLYRDFFYPIGKEIQDWVVKPSYPQKSHEPHFTWLGHATFLIQIGGKNILTDPIFGNMSVIFSRILPHNIPTKDLPVIDYIILSHNHPDHMDSNSLREIQRHNPHVKVLVPMGDKVWFDAQGFKDCSEHFWWDEIEFDGLKFTFLPAKHWSQRGLFDKNKSLWGSWMIEHNGFKFYFAGDTGWGRHFSIIGEMFKSIDVALMPIGPGEPRESMKHSHINAEEAGQAFLELKARWFVPMHWGTFRLGMDRFKEPVVRIKNWWQLHKKQCTHKMLKIVKVGELVSCVQENVIAFSQLKSKEHSNVL